MDGADLPVDVELEPRDLCRGVADLPCDLDRRVVQRGHLKARSRGHCDGENGKKIYKNCTVRD